jgi:hypothetical protein
MQLRVIINVITLKIDFFDALMEIFTNKRCPIFRKDSLPKNMR